MIYIYICCAIILLSLWYKFYKHNYIRQIYLSSKMPGPRGWPIIGNGLLFLNQPAAGKIFKVKNYTAFNF